MHRTNYRKSSQIADRLTAKQSGFTLIELLVVIAIIAILAAILFPVFAQAREKARQSVCISNEKQIMLGIIQYAGDYDEINPYVFGYGSTLNNGPTPSWVQAIVPYTKSSGIFFCPTDTYNRGANETNGNSQVLGHPAIPVSYSMNLIWGDWSGTMSFSGSSLAGITSPATTIAVAERWNGYHMYDVNWAADVSCTPDDGRGEFLPTNATGLFSATAHLGGSNYAFADGHAKWLRFEQTMKQQGSEPVYNDAQYNNINSWIVGNERCYSTVASSIANTKDAAYWGMWTTKQ